MGALARRKDSDCRIHSGHARTWFAKAAVWVLPLAIGLIAADEPAFARLLHTRPTPSANWSPFSPLVIGGGVEYERDSEQHQFDFPLLFEYHFTETMQIAVEPNFVHVDARIADVETYTALGDTELSFEWEIIPERRYRPAFTPTMVIRFPTASNPDAGEKGYDTTLGLILSKDLVFIDLDFNVAYTFVHGQRNPDALELSLAGEIPLSHTIIIEAEVVHALGTGGVRGQPGTIGGLGSGATNSETEATLGFAWQATPHLKFEQGVAVRSDRTWQVVFAWEYSFAGEY